MPKRNKKSASSQRNASHVRGPAPTWSIEERLGYHLAECAMHLQTIETIINDEWPSSDTLKILKHRQQAGLRIKAMWRICEKRFPNMLKQPK